MIRENMNQIFLIIAVFISSVYASAQNDSITRDYNLEEVVVAATRPLSKLDNEGIITTVAGTPLQNLETVNDLLGYIPGVTNNNGSIEVVGKGQPIIYLNGRKILNLSVLGQLPAAKVKDVKVINNPGARYGGDVNAVIRISTLKELGDGFSLDARGVIGIRNYLYTKQFLNMNYRMKDLDIFASFDYNNSKSKGSRYDAQNYYGNNKRNSISETSAIRRNQMVDGKIGLNYSIGSKHSFGAYYQHSRKPTKVTTSGITSLILTGLMPIDSNMERHEKEKYYDNLIDAYYSGMWGKWAVDASFDYLWRNNNT